MELGNFLKFIRTYNRLNMRRLQVSREMREEAKKIVDVKEKWAQLKEAEKILRYIKEGYEAAEPHGI